MIGVFNFTFSLDESKFSWSDPCFCWLYPFKSEFSMEKSLLGTRRSSLWLQLRQLSKSLGRQIFQRCQDVQFRSAWAAGGMLLRKGMAIIIPSYPIHRICFHQHVYRLNKGNCDILCDQIYYSTYGILMGPLFVCLFFFPLPCLITEGLSCLWDQRGIIPNALFRCFYQIKCLPGYGKSNTICM